MVAARKPGHAPDNQSRLVFVELKYGHEAIDGKAGIRAHMNDLHVLMSDGHLEDRAKEMVNVVRQKYELGLLPAPISDFDLRAYPRRTPAPRHEPLDRLAV